MVDDVFTNILFLVFLCGVAVLAISLVFYYNFLKKHAFLEIAKEHGMRYYFRSYGIPKRFSFLHQHRRGKGRYASNILLGRYNNTEAVLFDYRFSTGLGNEKRWHTGSFAVMYHGLDCPPLRIYPKAMLPSLGQIVGYDEIFIEDETLQDKFSFFTTDEKFARELLIPPVLDYLRRHPTISVEIDPVWIAVGSLDCLGPEEITYRLKQVEKLRAVLKGLQPAEQYSSA